MILRYGGVGLGGGSAIGLVVVAMKTVQSAASAADRAVLGAVTPDTLGMGEEVRIRWNYDNGNGGMFRRYWSTALGKKDEDNTHSVKCISYHNTPLFHVLFIGMGSFVTYLVSYHTYGGRRIVHEVPDGTLKPSVQQKQKQQRQITQSSNQHHESPLLLRHADCLSISNIGRLRRYCAVFAYLQYFGCSLQQHLIF